MKIAIQRASPQQRLQAFENAYEAWGGDLSPEAALKRRLDSETHKRAQWWVLTADGEVASALGRQRLTFKVGGEIVEAFGFGSVHTLSRWRRRGFAMQLCRASMKDAVDQGARVGLLFSDIPESYYARLGFVGCRSLKYNCMDPGALAASGAQLTLRRIAAPLSAIDLLTRAYRSEFAGDEVSLWRDAAYTRHVIEKDRCDEYFCIEEGSRELGYVRAFIGTEVVFPVEIALFDPQDDALRSKVLRKLAAMAHETGAARLSAWLSPTPAAMPFFETVRRPKSTTMVWTHPDLRIDALSLEKDFRVSPADYF